jgi:hypothetical protein
MMKLKWGTPRRNGEGRRSFAQAQAALTGSSIAAPAIVGVCMLYLSMGVSEGWRIKRKDSSCTPAAVCRLSQNKSEGGVETQQWCHGKTHKAPAP